MESTDVVAGNPRRRQQDGDSDLEHARSRLDDWHERTTTERQGLASMLTVLADHTVRQESL